MLQVAAMNYHLNGIINSLLFTLTLAGLVTQLRLVWARKHAHRNGDLAEGPTAVLSLNQFVSSFLGFFSFLFYGACLEPFNHYLVWTRTAAALLTLAVLWEIMITRRERVSVLSFFGCFALLIAGPVALRLDPSAAIWGRHFSQGLIVVVTCILGQGYLHQVVLMRQQGRAGAVSLQLHQFFFIKDVSTIVFALAMGLNSGCPLLLLSSVSGITKAAIMWHFRWVRLSPVAEQRRSSFVVATDLTP